MEPSIYKVKLLGWYSLQVPFHYMKQVYQIHNVMMLEKEIVKQSYLIDSLYKYLFIMCGRCVSERLCLKRKEDMNIVNIKKKNLFTICNRCGKREIIQ